MRSANSLSFILQEIFTVSLFLRFAIILTYRTHHPICLETRVLLGWKTQNKTHAHTQTKCRQDLPRGRGLPSTRNRFQTYVWYGMLHTAGVRRDNRETKKISWSIKESDFARLMSFPSSSRRERISSSGPLGKEMVDCRWRWEMLFIM